MFLSAYGQTLSFEHHVTMMRNNILTSTSQMYQQIIQIIQHFSDLPWSFIVVLIALHRLLHSVPCYNVVFVSTELIDSQDKSSAVASPLDQAIVYACLRMFTHVYACLRCTWTLPKTGNCWCNLRFVIVCSGDNKQQRRFLFSIRLGVHVLENQSRFNSAPEKK